MTNTNIGTDIGPDIGTDIGTAAGADPAGFHDVCDLDDLWAGETRLVEVAGTRVLLVHTEDGVVTAVQDRCPHQKVSLADAELAGEKLTCPMHLWEMNAVTGCGINPPHAALAVYPTKVIDGRIHVSVHGIVPVSSRS